MPCMHYINSPLIPRLLLVLGHRLKVRWAYSNAAPEVISKDASKSLLQLLF